jgi:RND superfamily putative drug exporter
MVAVGVDYSIFLAARIKQEASRWPMVEATRRAVIHTGPVISSCGVIMAATLGSLMAGDLKLLLQLGFAFSLGMLLDTFMVRPLLLPAFAVLVRPRRKAAQEDARAP